MRPRGFLDLAFQTLFRASRDVDQNGVLSRTGSHSCQGAVRSTVRS